MFFFSHKRKANWFHQRKKVKQRKICFDLKHFNHIDVACEQALRGALAAGRDKEGELATTSLEFDYLHRKSRCEMLIGGDDIRNEALPLARVFQCLFPLALIGGNLTAQSTGSRRATGELEVEFKFQRRSCKLSFLFPPRRQSAPESLLTGYTWQGPHNRAWLKVRVAWSAHCQILLRFQLFHILQESNQWNRWATRRVLRLFVLLQDTLPTDFFSTN